MRLEEEPRPTTCQPYKLLAPRAPPAGAGPCTRDFGGSAEGANTDDAERQPDCPAVAKSPTLSEAAQERLRASGHEGALFAAEFHRITGLRDGMIKERKISMVFCSHSSIGSVCVELARHGPESEAVGWRYKARDAFLACVLDDFRARFVEGDEGTDSVF